MRIVDHKLENVPFNLTPNAGGELSAEYLVVHYTATQGGESAIRALVAPGTKASAHVVVDLDGSVTQLLPFNRVAWHAGKSQWAGRAGCNNFSIGIEIANPGPLRKQGASYCDVYGRPWSGGVVEARHKNGGAPYEYWAVYPEAQFATLQELGALLVETYHLKDVVGHDDIAPGRKIDPGPAFPMDGYRGGLFGRADDGPDLYAATTVLNVRKGPAVSFDPVPGSPLAAGDRVAIVQRVEPWCHVVTPGANVEGWVHSRFLTPV